MFALQFLSSFQVHSAPEVKLSVSTVIGKEIRYDGAHQEFFGGIPYAEPPVGPLRLKAPVAKSDMEVENGVFDASEYGYSCIQPGVAEDSVSEDCLTVNILRPATLPENTSLPVLFWTYGGGFSSGTASSYNGSAIVARSIARGTPIIYVNFNYRLGPLGFPQGNEAGSRRYLNLGIKDQMMALEWVNTNIARFGGNNERITIFGQSAGGVMTSVLLLQPHISNLAVGAIIQSGALAALPFFAPERNENAWNTFVSSVPGCRSWVGTSFTMNCLRKANTSAILEGFREVYKNPQASEEFWFSPNVDGEGGLVPDLPSRLSTDIQLPFIAGTNLDEGTEFVPSRHDLSGDNIKDIVDETYRPPTIPSDVMDDLMMLYPDDPALGSPYGTGKETFGLSSGYKRMAAINGDLMFNSQRRMIMHHAANSRVKTFGYLFSCSLPSFPPQVGVPHGAELPFIFGGLGIWEDHVKGASAADWSLSETMLDYWISFASSLNPNDGLGHTRPIWPQYTPTSEVLLQFKCDNTTVVADDYRWEQIRYLNSKADVFHH
ncbi:extracellular triacylglycerol lipase precursor [Armillaria novae-zelandiae]|uniref:Carboxylic ester hydrolase n=1 Tax=Armillaria novae-zelandiae TaxID=153914 RepID=A0AA39P7U4_9AGAR|nr:extracellular triacylglycerol lipase precursor [Armillaria novae-zelandiae]